MYTCAYTCVLEKEIPIIRKTQDKFLEKGWASNTSIRVSMEGLIDNENIKCKSRC